MTEIVLPTVSNRRLPTRANEAIVSTTRVGKTFETPRGPVRAVEDVTLAFAPGSFNVIVGPSGCGKSTLLRMIAGLESPTSGDLSFTRAQENASAPTNALVFQGRSLFPWLNLRQNVAYGLRLQGISRAERSAKADELLHLVGLRKFSRSYPHQVSEGMRQRVAIARALAVDPDILLMDEPFGALDEQTRLLLQEELLRIWEATGKTVIFVTHSLDEALLLADTIVVMSAQPGTVRTVFRVPFPRPRTLTEVRKDPKFAELFSRTWEILRTEVNAARARQEQEIA
ncbi:MAG TPA: ABC transporter ATP-binding protein [Thermomicrobiales bacterium]|nr:ABC transporter ATP-binding protein [Thermomicrobiales bacterium]